jgi:sarcosine oxidase, subunit alpha
MSGYRLENVTQTERVVATFDGMPLAARRGESLAATLLANGVAVAGRSFKYHRPRGIAGYGWCEPNILVQTSEGTIPAAQLQVTDGLQARSVNCWPSARFDIASLLGAFAALMPAGFYYKTFRGPRGRLWPLFEPAIRALAGLGTLPETARPLASLKRFAHCDVLVIGGGPAGIAAAEAASEDPAARVWLIEASGATQATAALRTRHNVQVLHDTVATGRYDGGLVVALERPCTGSLETRLWKVRARSIVVATGAFERPFIFDGNDRPGVMLLSAVAAYASRDKVACGRRIVAMVNNAAAYADIAALAAVGMTVAAIVDLRSVIEPELRDFAARNGILLYPGHSVVAASGVPLRKVRIAPLDQPTRGSELACDALAMAGGWTPAVHLHSHAGGKLHFDETIAAFVPDGAHDKCWSAGACNGRFAHNDAVADGRHAGLVACAAAGFATSPGAAPQTAAPSPGALLARWETGDGTGKAFVDVAADVTADDIRLAVREGYDSVELMKRYTTAGMAPDQGRFGNMNAIDVLARARDVAPATAGTTTYRPPFVPVPFGAIADFGGTLLKPSRTTTLTAWHEGENAVMYEAGANWRRPGYYPGAGEDLDAATRRECRAVRNAAGIYDSSPLGKFEVVGPDAAAFLDFVYCTRLSDLKPGYGRYGLQLYEDGRLFDDGIVFRLGTDRFFVTTTTGNADACVQRFAYARQVLRPDLAVHVLPVTEQWADLVLCGPQARNVLHAAGAELPGEFPFMAIADARVAGCDVRVARAGFTGEVSFEIFTPAHAAPAVWRRLLEAGKPYGLTPVGSEANHVLRIEKGYVSVGHDCDGIADPDDLGLRFAVHIDKADFIGKQALLRNRADPSGRPQRVGLLTRDPTFVLPEGTAILKADAAESRGYVTASCWSDALGRALALGLLEDGRRHIGSEVAISLPGGIAHATVVAPVFFDAKGERQRG